MTHRKKRLYHKIKRIIDLNTLNTVQGPTMKRGPLRHKVAPEHTSNEFRESIQMLRKNGEIIQINRENYTEYTLREDEYLQSVQEKESQKQEPNKELIGYLHRVRKQ